MDQFIQQAFNFAKTYHEKDCSGHDFSHILRVYQNACTLLNETKNADAFIVKISALLHDIDDRKLNFGEKKVERFLTKIQVPKNKTVIILDTINSIGFSTTGTKPNLDSIEKKILFDADKLDALGSIGICRTIMYGTGKNTPLFDSEIFPKENLTLEEYSKLNRTDHTIIHHFFDKLLKLPNIMQTESGKVEAQKRQKIMIQFLNEFFREQGQEKWINFLNNYLQTINNR